MDPILPLIEALKDENFSVRQDAIDALGEYQAKILNCNQIFRCRMRSLFGDHTAANIEGSEELLSM